LSIITLNNNYWNYDNVLSNVGGILGFALEQCTAYCTGVFMEHPDRPATMTVALSPESDFDWWLKSSGAEINRDLWDYQSSIILDDEKALSNKGTGSRITLTTEKPDLLFRSNSFRFGDIEFNDRDVEISMGIAGVGLPE
jgi:hypothetical protein